MKTITFIHCARFVTRNGYVWSTYTGIWGFGEYLGNVLSTIPNDRGQFALYGITSLPQSDRGLSYYLRKNI